MSLQHTLATEAMVVYYRMSRQTTARLERAVAMKNGIAQFMAPITFNYQTKEQP
jgi:hypothetical protein